MRLENKVALLTGIGQNMGRATSLLFAQEGAKVALTARKHDGLNETAALIRATNGTCLVVPADVSVKSEAKAAVKKFSRNMVV